MKFKTCAAGLSLIIALFLFSSLTIAQNAGAQSTDDLPNPFLLTRDNIAQNNYITPIFDLKAREEKYLASPRFRQSYLERIIQLENFVGDYDEAYRYEDMLYSDFPTTKRMIEQYKNDIDDIKKSPVAGYKMLDAVDAIDAIAGSRQVIMINEEHRTPFHRALALQLLEKLYAKGFRYFAAETVDESDADLNKRGYPAQNTGYYTADPVYADLVRTALKLGYKVVPYESMDMTCKAPEDNPVFCDDRREREQARNLYERILKTDPQAKIFVHVGRGHNSKAEISKEFNFMAYYFKELSKIEPFTIDQLRFSQRFNPALERPLYRFLTKANLLGKPSVFQSPKGDFYEPTAGFDMMIFHPRIRYENGRATFLRMNGIRAARKINLKKLKIDSRKRIFTGAEPVLVQAFYARESAAAVPVDQIMLYPNRQIPVLLLPKGNFRVRSLDKSGKTIAEYQN
jgi:tetratricopeptide (TPR) repeat protein